MRTVKARVLSSQPISISAAAKALSHFAVSENGATQAVSVYLRRASDAFKELAALHRELRDPNSERKHKKKARSDTSRSTVHQTENPKQDQHCGDSEGLAEFDGRAFVDKKKRVPAGEVVEEVDDGNRKERKKRKSDEVPNGAFVDKKKRVRAGEVVEEVDEGNRKERKKRKSDEVPNGDVAESAERHTKKKRRKNGSV